MPSSRRSNRIASKAKNTASTAFTASATAPAATASKSSAKISGVGKGKGKRSRNKSNNRQITSTKKIAKLTKKAAKDEITKKIKNTYKVTASTGTNQSQIMNAIGETISGSHFLSASSQESKTIKDLLLPKLYGLKSTKVVRDILEVPAKPSTVQGPSLYGCGGTGLPVLGSTSSWFFPGTPAEKEAMKNSGLVFCWMSLVACTFKQGGGSFCGRGINHEMEHAMPCAGQVIGNLLAQSLNVGEDKHYRKHHVILFEVMKVLLAGKVLSDGRPVTETMIKRYVYLIMRMIRRQQVTMGLPSISVTNQKKCQLNLLMMTVDPETLKVTLSPNESEVNNIMDSVGSADKKGMILKPGKPVSFSPCGWCGVNNPESAFASPQRLEELYSTGYRTTTDQPDATRIAAAVRSATTFRAKSQEDKRRTLMTQCEKVCNVYNEMGEAMIDNQSENLSCFIISASIIVLSVIIKSTYKELGVETIHMPELFKWVNKAKEILSDESELERLLGEGKPGARWIIEQSQYLADESGNEVTANYLKFRDATINDFAGSEEMSDLGGILAGGGGEESRLGIELDGEPDIPVSGSSAPLSPITPGTPAGFYEWATNAAAGPLNFELLTDEINNCFKYGDSLAERENLGVEEYATLMFDYFERMSIDINPDFISGIEVKIDSLTTLELEELYFTTFGLELEIIDEESQDPDQMEEEDTMGQAAINRTFTSGTAAAMDALAASVPENEMEGSETLPFDYDSQMTDSDDFSESEEEVEFEDEDEIEEMKLENPLGFGGGKKKSKKKTKRKNIKKSKKRKNTKRKSMVKKNTKRKSNKKNTKRKSNKKNTKK